MTPIAATMPARPRARRLGFLVVLLAFAVAGCALPFVVKSQLFLTLMTQAAINAVLATGVGFLVRQSGNVSFGHAAFFGLSAYATALLIKFGLPAEAAIVLAVLLPTLFALALGVVIVRVTGVAFSMLTLAVAQAFHELVLKWRELANGDDGMAIAFPSRVFGIDMATFQQPASMFLISWMTLVAIILGLWLLQRSHFGTLTLAIRENEERALHRLPHGGPAGDRLCRLGRHRLGRRPAVRPLQRLRVARHAALEPVGRGPDHGHHRRPAAGVGAGAGRRHLLLHQERGRRLHRSLAGRHRHHPDPGDGAAAAWRRRHHRLGHGPADREEGAMTASTFAIEGVGMTRRFGGFAALDGVSLAVPTARSAA